MIFDTVFGQSGTGLRFGFDSETNVFGFCGVFWYYSNSVKNCKETKKCPVLCGLRFWSFCVLLL